MSFIRNERCKRFPLEIVIFKLCHLSGKGAIFMFAAIRCHDLSVHGILIDYWKHFDWKLNRSGCIRSNRILLIPFFYNTIRFVQID